jgi:hypothetical protein
VGFDRLAASATRHLDLPVSEFVDAVLGDLLSSRLDDDVAMLAVRFHAEGLD